MGTLYWLRMARRAKLYKQPEFPNIEALIEAEHGQPADEYLMLAKIIPACIIGFGAIVGIIAAGVQRSPWPLTSIFFSGVVATGLYFIFDHFDKRIPRSLVKIRKQSKDLNTRMCALTNLVGVEPALSTSVGSVLDEAAQIYLKHRVDPKTDRSMLASIKPQAALEDAMAKMFDLVSGNARSQELEMQKGWAQALLQEMRDMDRDLDAHARSLVGGGISADDPLLQLRQARLELKNIDSAINELEQH